MNQIDSRGISLALSIRSSEKLFRKLLGIYQMVDRGKNIEAKLGNNS